MNPNERITLGPSALEVTRLGLGGAYLGAMFGQVTDETANAIVHRTLDLGMTLIDTAPLYGSSEVRIGAALRGVDRASYVLSTKVGRLVRPEGVVFDFSYDGVMRSVTESLGRLGLDRVDMLHIHDPDGADAFDEALHGAFRALDELRSQKVIGAVGAGMNRADWLARFAREGDFDCFLCAGRYTLLDQSAADELFPLALERNIGIILGGVYNSGLLAGGTTYDYGPAPDELTARARRIGEVCARHKIPLKAAAIQFPYAHPAVTSIITGASTVAELEETFGLTQIPIPADLWAELKSEALLPADAVTPNSPYPR